jgi:dihydrofolate synthase/folylpolyglutamate synthase
MRSLAAWLSYLETLHPKAIDLGLERVRIVAQHLQLLPFSFPVITVAGTKGKGSTVATIESIYVAAGYHVASYTSPHLLIFNERIKLNQSPVSDQQLCEAFALIEKARGDITLTYFEFTTLAALWIFAQHALDVVILEVGMGGRLDAVNIVDPIISVITNIALDHTEYLGSTREAIAIEKAGIFRHGVPAICGDADPPATLLAAAQNHGAVMQRVDDNFFYQVSENSWSWWNDKICFAGLPRGHLWIPNMATALATVMCLQQRFPVGLSAMCHGVARAQVMGRFQCINENPFVIVDVAHNPAGAQHLVQRLQENPVTGKTWLVFSMLRDKDIHAAVHALSDIADEWLIAPLACERSASVEMLSQVLRDSRVDAEKIKQFASINDAYAAALQSAQAHDRIVVTGSFYTVGDFILSSATEL